MDFWQISGIAQSYSVISLTRRISAQIVLATCPEARFCSEILGFLSALRGGAGRCAACERDLERPRVLLSAVHVTVRCCLCDIVMLSLCALSEGVPGVRSFTLLPRVVASLSTVEAFARGRVVSWPICSH